MHNINFYDLLVQNKKVSISHIRDTLPDDIIESLSYAVEYWHVTEQRENFKRIFEENIPTNNDVISSSFFFYLVYLMLGG